MTIDFKVQHVSAPTKVKSENFHEITDKWLCTINGIEFDYYTGIGHRVAISRPRISSSGYSFRELLMKTLTYEGLKQFIAISKPVPPKLDDLLHSLVTDASAAEMSFEDWCGDYGYDTDSIKALETYRECQQIASKLRKAKINIAAERKRLENY